MGRKAILVHGTLGRGIFPDERFEFWASSQPIWPEPRPKNPKKTKGKWVSN